MFINNNSYITNKKCEFLTLVKDNTWILALTKKYNLMHVKTKLGQSDHFLCYCSVPRGICCLTLAGCYN